VWFRCPVEIADETYVVLSTRPGSGESERAPVVPLSDGRLGLWTVAEITDGQPVAVRSERPDAPELRGTAELVRSGRWFDEVVAKARRKYGLRSRASHIDLVVLVRLDGYSGSEHR
jgi:hypothetical protein